MNRHHFACLVGGIGIGFLIGCGICTPIGVFIGHRTLPKSEVKIEQKVEKPADKKIDNRSLLQKAADNLSGTYTRQGFKDAIRGKSKDEIVKIIGKPNKTSTDTVFSHIDRGIRMTANEEYWVYHDKTVDPISGSTDRFVMITFRTNSTEVTFIP